MFLFFSSPSSRLDSSFLPTTAANAERLDAARFAAEQRQHILQAGSVRTDFLFRLHLPADGAVK